MVDENDDLIKKATNPLVFISHDTRDRELAEAFSALLKSVSTGVLKSFRTSDRKGNQGIEYGVEWYPEIIKHIQGASDVVCLLTRRSVNRPWILFEAGMAKGKLDTPILGLALGIHLNEASTGPFAQFQNCGDDEESLTKLVFQLVNRIPNSEPDEDTIKFHVSKFKESVARILSALDQADTSSKEAETTMPEADNSSAKLFEEIKIMFQDLPSRIDKRSISMKRRNRKFHPSMFDEMISMSKNPIMGIKMALSLYRDKMPWIYEEGILLLNRIQRARHVSPRNSASANAKTLSEFEHLLMMSTHGRFSDFFVDDDEDYVLLRELPRMILDSLHRLFDRQEILVD